MEWAMNELEKLEEKYLTLREAALREADLREAAEVLSPFLCECCICFYVGDLNQ